MKRRAAPKSPHVRVAVGVCRAIEVTPRRAVKLKTEAAKRPARRAARFI